MSEIPEKRKIEPESSFLGDLMLPLKVFGKALWRNKAGLVGFIGLVFFLLLITIGPVLVPFDDQVKLDQIAAPPGSRLQLLVHADDAERFRSLQDFEGQGVLAYVEKTGAEDLVAPYVDDPNYTIEDFRFRSGRGVRESVDALARDEIDGLIIFSENVRMIVNGPDAPEAYQNLVVSNEGLGVPHLLGTDTQGRDIFSHIVNGGGSLIVTALLAGMFSTLIAIVLGSVAALQGGLPDRMLTAAANFVLTIPRFPLLVVLAVLVGDQLSNFVLLAALIASLSWPVLMRAIRSLVLSLRERDYVEVARALDLGTGHIIMREILPNMMSFVAINFIFATTAAMYLQIGLIFLGMAPITDYSWGVMLYFGRTRGTLFSADSASMVLSPVIAIALFQVSLVLFARAVEEMFDPRLRSA